MNDSITMLRPGGTNIVRHAIEQSNLKEGSKLLDIGCGAGDTAAFLTETFGLCVTGVDIDKDSITKAQNRFPNINFVEGDSSMLDFVSKTFDGALMECSLSLVHNTTEAIHEAWCILKGGGQLIISDLYWKNPTADHLAAIAEARESNRKPRRHGECHDQELLSECVADGAFIMDEIYRELQELDMEVKLFEDRSDDLISYAAEILLAYGSFEAYAKANPTAFCPGSGCPGEWQDKGQKNNLGYFLLIAEKKET